jgi:dCTP deaminase
MQLLSKNEILKRMKASEGKALSIQPLLFDSQIGEVTVDLRLGYDFLVSVLTRNPFISLNEKDPSFRGISSYFQSTRREIGDRFVLYPNQLVIATTLEYVGLPTDVFADLLTRSSYTRLGIALSTMIQPGFRGCFPLELFNHSNNPVELVVGSRLVQMKLYSLGKVSAYQQSNARKYFGGVRPVASKATQDPDLELLEKIRLAN